MQVLKWDLTHCVAGDHLPRRKSIQGLERNPFSTWRRTTPSGPASSMYMYVVLNCGLEIWECFSRTVYVGQLCLRLVTQYQDCGRSTVRLEVFLIYVDSEQVFYHSNHVVIWMTVSKHPNRAQLLQHFTIDRWSYRELSIYIKAILELECCRQSRETLTAPPDAPCERLSNAVN